ncbi:monocarboxylate transporter 12 [Octopus bimaculoides]|uniref:Major facilitator superfamily (MFS) profile domain-containing protein n=1 Tax=Octopus bimaculoides TaxID=37653 RepID=A0A0L8HJX5_OCTBM|nr:monocarboxylate transporter 12 [Octopus bimaculoides]XP_052823165.1 monocarboxylate transporter 12 [Octopus bimaculoides]XP_052823166.1 monocarboxylate transporter 12 [Octopus bimaculoides]XP_052823167.1 monocarboxylate transporter 12 [Octopus bimaculoides]|eukprot:XP_014771722.1 PREDICTED: monocarboxylate transporter 12-like [Octopus bimaculoides]
MKDKTKKENKEKYVEDDALSYYSEYEIPDGGWGWMVVLGSFFVHVIADGITYSLGIFYSKWVDYFQTDKATMAWVGSLVPAMTYLTGPIAGALTNVYGCRRVAVVGSLLTTFGFIISIFVNNVYFLYFSFGILGGIGMGLIYLPAIVCVGFYFEKRRSFATGLAVCGAGIGTFIFAPLSQFLLEFYGWKGAVLISAGLILNCILCGALFKPLPKTKIPKETISPVSEKTFQNGNIKKRKELSVTPDEIVNLTKSENNLATRKLSIDSRHSQYSVGGTRSRISRRSFSGSSLLNVSVFQSHASVISMSVLSLHEQGQPSGGCWKETKTIFQQTLNPVLLTDPIFVIFLISNFFISVGYIVPYIYIPDYALEKNLNPNNAAMLVSVIGVSNTFGRVVFGYLSDNPRINRIILYATSLVICGIGTLVFPFLEIYPLQIFYSVIFGIFTGVFISITSVVLVDLLGLENLTNSFGLTLLIQGIATLIGPPFAGWLYDETKNYDFSFYLAGITLAGGGLLLYIIPFLKRYQKKKQHVITELTSDAPTMNSTPPQIVVSLTDIDSNHEEL